jgi:peptidoglycan glycosyltransferase
MSLINPFPSHKTGYLRRGRRSKLPSFRTVAFITLLVLGALFSKTTLLNHYHLFRGLKDWQQDKLELARLEFEKILDRSPGDPQAIDGLGVIEMKAGNVDKAKDFYAQALKAGLKASRRFNHLKTGTAFMDAGQYIQAQAEFEHAIELEPNNAEAYLALGTVLRAQGLVVNGVKDYEKALTLDPKNKNIQLLLEQGREERDRGAIYYIFDRNGQPLAQMWYKTGERSYPYGKEFAHIIGWNDSKDTNNRGATGLEKAYADQFPGNKLYLTLDARVQRLLSKAMGWHMGSIVVLNPRTGEILGALSQPTFMPEKIHDDWWKYIASSNKPLFCRPFEGLYEPGSIIKIITSAAALDRNLDLKQIFPFFDRGYEYIDSKPFYDWKKLGTIHSLSEAFDSSSNIAFAKVGFLLGNDTLYEYDNRFGFNAAMKNIPIPVSISKSPKLGLSRYELAEASTGLGKDFRITPLNAAMIASAIANDGILMSPYMVSRITNIEGKVLQEQKPQVFQKATTKQTARAITEMMINDVERGIGAKARVAVYRVAGKTGTSGTRDPNFHAWFICFAPAENPKIAMAILAEHGGTGKDVAAPIARIVLEGLADMIDSFGPTGTK